ncbi:spore germination protein [Bacillus suaedaesalsae]|uniref:Spore germination protein n=1 Tax=Bacillus suaedaesalsae TaxID=2810349 RepID=A0ABS2DK17_9BACI|nr:spore germination protein [Bacillus suaedaesalsae]MBM6617818.1 spore germination protein [Bacillus suaedaesalsae]
METLITDIKIALGDNDDFFIKRDYLIEEEVVFLGLNTLLDITKTKTTLQKQTESLILKGKTTQLLFNLIGDVFENDTKRAISSILEGKLIIFIENTKQFIIYEPISKSINRSIEIPTNENVIQGPLNSFTEDIDTNIGLLRKQLISKQLIVHTTSTGMVQKTNVSLLYLNDKVDQKLVDNIKSLIEKNNDLEITDLQGLSKMLEFSSWDTISKFNTTELPFHASQFLKRGRVILFVNQLPFALILPNLIWDMFIVENDRNFPFPIMIAIRFLRIIGILVALIAPGLYVALVAVNPEVLQIELALSVAQSREGVPYPALVEVIIMLIVLELIIEASVRLPKSVGQTITMVGGIILGQAVVEAKLVSNLLIIILAATTIANSTLVGTQSTTSIRLFKYINIILSSLYGVLGLVTGIVLICSYFASLTTFGKSYLYLNIERKDNSG